MPINDPSKVIFSTLYSYFLNYDTQTGSVNVPATSYATGESKSYTVVIPIDRTQDYSQIQINFSFDSTKWYILPVGDVTLDIAFGSVTTVASYSGANLTITFYVVNQVVGPINNPAFTVTVRSLLFVTPT